MYNGHFNDYKLYLIDMISWTSKILQVGSYIMHLCIVIGKRDGDWYSFSLSNNQTTGAGSTTLCSTAHEKESCFFFFSIIPQKENCC